MDYGFKLPDYGKVWNLGHPEVAGIFDGPVRAQEKIDGSQFSFMRDEEGQLHFRSRNAIVHAGSGGMFAAGVEAVERIADRLPECIVVRGEYLAKPQHNTLAYERVPRNHIMLFDAGDLHGSWFGREQLDALGALLGFEVVPEVALEVHSADHLDEVCGGTSVLGSSMEGLVFKAYGRHDTRGHLLKAKHVRARFREINRAESPARSVAQGEVIQKLVARYHNEARFEKALHRLRDRGELTHTPRDIGPLLRELHDDAAEEIADDAKAILWGWARANVLRALQAGLPEWYKARLVERQFEDDE